MSRLWRHPRNFESVLCSFGDRLFDYQNKPSIDFPGMFRAFGTHSALFPRSLSQAAVFVSYWDDLCEARLQYALTGYYQSGMELFL